MPDYEWKCAKCGEHNPPYTEVCRSCYQLPSSDSRPVERFTFSRRFNLSLQIIGIFALFLASFLPGPSWLKTALFIICGVAGTFLWLRTYWDDHLIKEANEEARKFEDR